MCFELISVKSPFENERKSFESKHVFIIDLYFSLLKSLKKIMFERIDSFCNKKVDCETYAIFP